MSPTCLTVDTTVPHAELTQDGIHFDWSKILLGWNTLENKPAPIPQPNNSYSNGIAADSHGRVWFAGMRQRKIVACFYDHHASENNQWGRSELPFNRDNQNFNPHGIAFDIHGNIYMSGHSGDLNTHLTRFPWNEKKEDTGIGKCEFYPLRGAENAVLLNNAQCPDTGGIPRETLGPQVIQ